MAGDLRFHERELAEALPLFERALELDPVWEPALMHVMDALAGLGRIDELLARSRRWVEKAPGGASYRALAHAEIAAGRFEDAERDARRAFELDGNIFSRVALAEALELGERYGEAEALVRPVAERAEASPDRKKAAASLAAALAYQGRRREALAVIDRLAAHAPPPSEPSLRVLHLLGEDSLDAARAEAERLAASGSRWDGIATVLALAGDLDGAAARARDIPPGPGRTTVRGGRGVAWRRPRSCARAPASSARLPAPRQRSRDRRDVDRGERRDGRWSRGRGHRGAAQSAGRCPAASHAAGCTRGASTSRRWRSTGSASARGPRESVDHLLDAAARRRSRPAAARRGEGAAAAAHRGGAPSERGTPVGQNVHLGPFTPPQGR